MVSDLLPATTVRLVCPGVFGSKVQLPTWLPAGGLFTHCMVLGLTVQLPEPLTHTPGALDHCTCICKKAVWSVLMVTDVTGLPLLSTSRIAMIVPV